MKPSAEPGEGGKSAEDQNAIVAVTAAVKEIVLQILKADDLPAMCFVVLSRQDDPRPDAGLVKACRALLSKEGVVMQRR